MFPLFSSPVPGGPKLGEQYQYCLTLPVISRCYHLDSLISNTALKDLKQIYGNLVEEIFGFRHRNDWGLLMVEESFDGRDFGPLRLFLAPDGPLMQLAYKLSDDPQAHYNFPVSCLPAPTRQLMTQGIIPKFYSKRMSYACEGTISSYLQLNAFEFFIFHFSYFIVNPSSKNVLDCSRPQDTLYGLLLEDFLCYFLRNDGKIPEIPVTQPSSTASPPSPFKTSPSKIWASLTTPNPKKVDYSVISNDSFQSTPQRTISSPQSSLLKMDAFLVGNSPPNEVSGVLHAPPEIKIWKSEVFIEIITEMYLNQYMVEFPQKFSPLVETFVPNYHHVWTIRIFVKHIHSFTNNVAPNQNGPEFIIDPFSNLKSYLIPHYVQKKLFIFLKVVFQHWPLDATFRAPLETWLSYIQPWRYTNPMDNQNFTSRWQKFVTENLVFYSPFFVQVLLRLFRMDLTTVKNAYMLFRVTKVFSQNDLDTMIKEAEKNFFSNIKSMNIRSLQSSDPMSSNFKSPSFESTFPNSELTMGHYIPLFSPDVIAQVSRLLTEIVSAQERTANNPSNIDSCSQSDKSFFSQVSSWFDDRSPHSGEPFYDGLKLDVHLEGSANQLCKLFKILPSSIAVRQSKFGNLSSMNVSSTNHVIENQNSRDQNFLRRLHLLGGGPTQKIIFKGNPDKQPTRTYEIDTLVKGFREISDLMNAKYALQINDLYYRPSVFGRMCQQLFAPPAVYQEILKSKDMMLNSQIEVCLPPRICLRHFASMHVIRNYILYFVLLYFVVGLHPVVAFFLLVIYKVFMIFFRAIFHLHKPESKQD